MFVHDVLEVILQRCSGLKASFVSNREIYQLFVESFTGSLNKLLDVSSLSGRSY